MTRSTFKPAAPGWTAFLARHSGLLGDVAVMAAAGLFFAAIGPFDTDTADFRLRLVYWIAVMVVGAFVVLGAEGLRKRLFGAGPLALRMAVTTLLATPLQTVVVMAAGVLVFGYRPRLDVFIELLPAVLVVTFAAVTVLEIARRARHEMEGPVRAEPAERVDGLAPPPEALARFLPARLRQSDLIALSAEDHYVRVHTAAGADLVLIRLSDAIALVADRPGLRLHRSWWVAQSAIERASFSRGSGTVTLTGGIEAPLSRTHAPRLREKGWL